MGKCGPVMYKHVLIRVQGGEFGASLEEWVIYNGDAN